MLGPATLDLTESQTMIALRGLVLAVLPTMEVVQAQVNRVAEPSGLNFVDFNSVVRERLDTNTHDYADALFAGKISGTTLTVTAMGFGEVVVGRQLFGTQVADGTRITDFGTGSGGIGTYVVSVPQTLSERRLAAGIMNLRQSTRLEVQIDIHGPASGDNAQILSTVLRDELAIELLAQSGFDVTPLYADSPRQIPFLNGEHQVENRWIVSTSLEVNPTVSWPQQFASSLRVGLIEVDEQFPPTEP